MKRKHLCLAGYTLVALTAVGCASRQPLEVYATNPVQSPPAVQQMVADAHKAEVAGNSDQALTMYRQVLAEDPGNAWAKHRVEKLSGTAEAPILAQRRMERLTGRTGAEQTAPAAPTNDARIQQVADTRVAQAKQAEGAARTNQQENPFEDWFDKSHEAAASKELARREQDARQQVAAAPVPEWARTAEAKPTPTPAAAKEEFAWATNTEQKTVAVAPQTPAAEIPTPTKERAVATISDESVFAALERGRNPFEELESQKPVAEAKPQGRFDWATEPQNPVVQADTSASAAETRTSVERVAFSTNEETDYDGTPLVELCRDANVQVLGLVQQLESPMATIRREALNDLGLLGRKASTARLPVRILCDDPVPVVAAEAAWTLWQIDGDGYQAVRSLTKMVDSEDVAASEIAIQSLGLIGADAIGAAPVLRSRLTNATGIRRVRLAESLVRIEPEDTGALQALVEATRYGHSKERVEATYALAHTPAVHLDAIAPVLVNALHDDDEAVRTAAALTLGNFGPAAEHARLALEAASRFDTRPVRDAARATLACLPR